MFVLLRKGYRTVGVGGVSSRVFFILDFCLRLVCGTFLFHLYLADTRCKFVYRVYNLQRGFSEQCVAVTFLVFHKQCPL